MTIVLAGDQVLIDQKTWSHAIADGFVNVPVYWLNVAAFSANVASILDDQANASRVADSPRGSR